MTTTTDNWIGASSADWGANAANWSTGFPNSNNDVVINTGSILTITYSGSDTYVINSLNVGNDFFDMNGGSLTIQTTASFSNDFIQTGGMLSVNGAVTISGTGTLTGGSSEGNTAFSISGTIALANYTLGGGSVLNNSHVTNLTGQITVGDNTGIDAGINNQSGGVFDIAGDFGISRGAATATFANAGTLEKTGGNGTSAININVTGNGAIDVATGTLELDGPINSFSGAISGAGQFALGGGGTNTIASGAAITAATFSIYGNGTIAALGENLTYANTFNLEQGSTLNLGGHTLTLGGTNTFNNESTTQPVIDGSGTLVTKFGTVSSINNLIIGGTASWHNAGTVNESATLTIGDGSSNAATFMNQGTYNLTTDTGMAHGAAATSQFTNAKGATLEKIAGTGNSVISVDTADSGGAVKVLTGTLEFTGPNNSFSGAISGAGQFAVGGGSSDSIASGATIAAATFSIFDNGTIVTLGENLSLAKIFNLEQGSTLNLGGHTLTLSGTSANTFNNENTTQPVIDGAGILVTASGSATGVNNFTLGGTVNWQNSGTVTESAAFTIGDGSANAATFTNESGGIYNLAGDSGVARGAAATSQFIDASGGTLEKTAGTGNSVISVDTADNGGAIKVNTGTVEFTGPNNSFSGAISGAGQFAVGGSSSDSIASGATIAAATFSIFDTGTIVTLGENLSLANIFNLEQGSTLNLGGHTLTLSSTSVNTFNNENTTQPVIDGAGILVTASGSVTGVNFFTLGGTVNWQNSATVNESETFTIGDGSSNAATFTNESGGIYNLAGDIGIAHGAVLTSQFIDATGATLEKTAGAGTSLISANTADSGGAIEVNTGTVEFTGPNNSFSGAISGAGQFAVGGGSSDSIASGATIAAGTFSIVDNGTIVTLGENLSFANTFNQVQGSTLNLGGHTLTLSGTSINTFNNENTTQPVIDGAGILVTASGSVTGVNIITLGGTVNWQNSGTVNETSTLTIGDGSANTAIFTNESGGVYNLTGDIGIARGAATTSRFIDATGSTLEKTAGTGTSTISAEIADNGGAIKVNTGTLEFTGPSNTFSFSAPISGVGQFVLGGGSNNTITNGATITASTFSIVDNGTIVTLGENLSFANAFNQVQGSTFNLGGHTLTLSGTSVNTFNNENTTQPVIDGSGTAVTASGSVTGVNNFTLGGTVNWQNSGTVNQTATLTIGDGSANAATFTNESGGVYDLSNDSGIARGAAATSGFTNSSGGTLEKTGGTGDSTIAVAMTNNGTVTDGTGEMEFQTTVGGTGAFNIATNSVLAFDANVLSGSTTSFLSTSSGELLLADSQQFAATVSGFGGSNTDSFDFRDINFNSAQFNLNYAGNATQGVLTVTDGTHTANINMLGDYTKASFVASTDHSNGTSIVHA